MTATSLAVDNWVTVPVTRGYIELAPPEDSAASAKPHVQAFSVAPAVVKINTINIKVP